MLSAGSAASGALEAVASVLGECAQTLSSTLNAKEGLELRARLPRRAADATLAVVLATSTPLLTAVEKLIERECRELAGAPCRASSHHDPDWGYVYEVTVDASAKRALELNLKLQERLPGVPVVVRWTGETDVTKEELVNYLVEAVVKGGFRARAPPGFDAVKAVREIRGR